MRKKRDEELNQVSLVSWFRVQYPQYRYLITIPSFGENIGPRRMQRLKQMGLTPGWPDIYIAIPSYVKYTDASKKTNKRLKYGLFIEMKTAKTKQTKQQQLIGEQLTAKGYLVSVCHNWDQAREIVKEYLNGAQERP